MPKTTSSGAARRDELPETLVRSDAKAQRTYAQAYDAAMDEYDDAERAARTAWAALKQTHEKVGDRWRPKDEHGSSEPEGSTGTHGGVDANATKEHLYGIAQELGIEGRSEMTKDELVAAIQRENDRRTSRDS